MGETEFVNRTQAQAFLASYLGHEPADLTLVGEGAWSRCYGFRRGAEALVIRFGRYVDDFHKDQRAAAYATPDLPIPQVLAVGPAFDGYFAISTRAYGVPLEELNAAQWRASVPAVAAALEAMRTADLSATAGFGGWGSDGQASCASWPAHLLAVGEDTPDRRTHGWRARLTTSSTGAAAFTWGFGLLQQAASNAVPRALLHCDLINRNALVHAGRLTGVFDWGCSRYGDHLYDLAWFEFWAPWYPELDMRLLRSELERRWREAGYTPENKTARLRACYLHIGLDHLAYNAYRGDWPSIGEVAAQMRALAAI